MDSALDFLPPSGNRTLADVVPSLLAALGARPFDNPLGVTAARSVCLLMIDGLGWQLLSDHAADAPFLAGLAAQAEPLVAGFPATTATSLASLGTGLPPGRHGMWRSRLGDRAWIATREEAIAAEWFGPTVADHVRDRIGDVIVAAAATTGVVCRTAEQLESGLLGHHGSFTADEQLVPLLLVSGAPTRRASPSAFHAPVPV